MDPHTLLDMGVQLKSQEIFLTTDWFEWTWEGGQDAPIVDVMVEFAVFKLLVTVGALTGVVRTLAQVAVDNVVVVSLDVAVRTGIASFGTVRLLMLGETGSLHRFTTQTACNVNK